MSKTLFENLIELQREKRTINNAMKELKEDAKDRLALQPYESEHGKVKLITYQRYVFDAARFKEENPELYAKYLKNITVSYVGVYPKRV